MKRRKIVKIAIGSSEQVDAVAALCDDGTAWTCYVKYLKPIIWTQLPPIPQSKALEVDE